jgi:hypothetical protein
MSRLNSEMPRSADLDEDHISAMTTNSDIGASFSSTAMHNTMMELVNIPNDSISLKYFDENIQTFTQSITQSGDLNDIFSKFREIVNQMLDDFEEQIRLDFDLAKNNGVELGLSVRAKLKELAEVSNKIEALGMKLSQITKMMDAVNSESDDL